MVKITDDMREIAGKTKGWALATVSKEGIPNVIPIGNGKVLSENEILLTDNFMGKTIENIKANPDKVAVSAWDWDTVQGYQFKGMARIETSGEVFEEAVHMAKSRAKARMTLLDAPRAKAELVSRTPRIEPKAAVVITVKSIYITTPGPDAGKEVK